ncbi:MAG: immunoglobulin domain-containing protein, partial [Verrucomicrobia bacterium]|nr:immunoglobulin domain-containing protein [Verrucomicrobiota bacterium]
YNHTVAVKTGGTLWAWGDNYNGQLGDGTTDGKSSPVQVGTDTNWQVVAAGSSHTVAVKTGGTLWAWGNNDYDPLGDGTTDSKSSPVQVGTDTKWQVVAAGYYHTVAVKTGGTLWAWGANWNGQLGDGTAWQETPIQIGAPVVHAPVIQVQPTSLTNVAGSTATFSVTASGTTPMAYQWRLYGTNLASQTSATLSRVNVQTNDAGPYTVVVTNLAGSLTSQVATLTVTLPITLGEALNAPLLPWTTGGNAPWIAQTSVTHDGAGAAQSGVITHSQQSWLETTVAGPGTLTFWWKVSSEQDWDYLEFRVNGSQQAFISGEVSWQQRSFALGSGTHTLRWSYGKDDVTSAGQDRGWVDEVSFVPSFLSITAQPQSQTVIQGAGVVFNVTAAGTGPLHYQWRLNGAALSGATSNSYSILAASTNAAWLQCHLHRFGGGHRTFALPMARQRHQHRGRHQHGFEPPERFNERRGWLPGGCDQLGREHYQLRGDASGARVAAVPGLRWGDGNSQRGLPHETGRDVPEPCGGDRSLHQSAQLDAVVHQHHPNHAHQVLGSGYHQPTQTLLPRDGGSLIQSNARYLIYDRECKLEQEQASFTH